MDAMEDDASESLKKGYKYELLKIIGEHADEIAEYRREKQRQIEEEDKKYPFSIKKSKAEEIATRDNTLKTDFCKKGDKNEIITYLFFTKWVLKIKLWVIIMKFNKIIPELSVSNLENSLKFYKLVGFKIEYERPEDKFVFLALGEIQFMLQEISKDDKWDIAPLLYPFGNGINFQLEVENVDKIYEMLKENDYDIAFEMEENWYRQDKKLLGNKEFLVTDPDGYLIRFSEDLGEKSI